MFSVSSCQMSLMGCIVIYCLTLSSIHENISDIHHPHQWYSNISYINHPHQWYSNNSDIHYPHQWYSNISDIHHPHQWYSNISDIHYPHQWYLNISDIHHPPQWYSNISDIRHPHQWYSNISDIYHLHQIYLNISDIIISICTQSSNIISHNIWLWNIWTRQNTDFTNVYISLANQVEYRPLSYNYCWDCNLIGWFVLNIYKAIYNAFTAMTSLQFCF